MIQKKHMKKITTFLLLLVTILTLVACSKKEAVPYGDISNDEYISLGDLKVTEKDVYNNLRRQGAQALPGMIEERLFAGYKLKTENLLEVVDPEEDSLEYWAQKEFDNLVNQAVFSTTDIDRIKEYKQFEFDVAVDTFVDQQYVKNSNTNRITLKTTLQGFIADPEDENFATQYYKEEVFRDLFLLNIQKKIYAKEILDKEALDKDSDYYIKDSSVISHYRSNVKTRHDANVFYFHFLSLNEANAALRNLNLKSNSRGHWFLVPDIRSVDELNNMGIYDEAYADEVAKYVADTIKKVNLGEKIKPKDDNPAVNSITEADYKRYYEAYSISESRDEKLGAATVLSKFIDLYNEVNGDELVNIDPDNIVINENQNDLINLKLNYTTGGEYETEKDYDALTKVGSSLRNYIYDTLTEEKPYSALRSVGNFRYLVFKLDANYNELNFVSEQKDADDKEKWVTADEIKEIIEDEEHEKRVDLLQALKDLGFVTGEATVDYEALQNHLDTNIASWENKVEFNTLTTAYVNDKVNDIYEDAKVEIFDNLIKTYYNQSAAHDAKGKAKTGANVLSFKAKLNDENIDFVITVNELFKKVDDEVGLETAIDLIVNKYLLKEYKDKNSTMFDGLDINEEKFKKELKELINNFSNDGFAQAGYPASIGRETFLLLIFGTKDMDEAIELGYIIPELRNHFVSDYDNHLDVDVYKELTYYASLQHDLFKGVNVGHLLVYFDQDGDDAPDKPEDFFKNLTEAKVLEVKKLIVELYNEVLFEVGQEGLSGEKLKAVADDFQSYARIPLGESKPIKWEKYRKAGLNLKYESLGSEITNTSNIPGAGSTLDKVFYDRAIKIHDLIMKDIAGDDVDENGAPIYVGDNEIIKDHLPYLDYGASLNVIQDPEELADLSNFDSTNLDELMSSFGFHFIMVTNVSQKLSAKYDGSDDSNNDYKVTIDEVEYTAYNEDKDDLGVIVQSQVEYYIKGNKLEDGVLLPSKVKQAFSQYFDPIFALYNNEIMRVEILNNLLIKEGLKLNGKEVRFETIREINQVQFHKYLLADDNYNALYGDWFERFGLGL